MRDAYDQLCQTYRAIDDFRAKLLGFLPLVTGGGLLLVTAKKADLDADLFKPVGIFGVAVTLGLFALELYGIRKCHALIEAGVCLERSLRLPAGQFKDRPKGVAGVINEPFAAAIVYPAVIAAWASLASYQPPDWRWEIGTSIFVAGFVSTLAYSLWLARYR
jgi:hypothetical protein